MPLGSDVTCTKAHKALATTHFLQSILQNLYKLQAVTMDSTQQQSLYRERRRIEGAQTEKGRQRHKHWSSSGRPEVMFRGIRMYLCSSKYTCCYKHIFAIRMEVGRPMTCLYRSSTVVSDLLSLAYTTPALLRPNILSRSIGTCRFTTGYFSSVVPVFP